MWIQKSGRAMPTFASRVLDYLGFSVHHPHQISLAQFSAYHLRDVVYNLDMLSIARTTKLTTKRNDQPEDETLDQIKLGSSLANMETKFFGGETNDAHDAVDEDLTEGACTPAQSFNHGQLIK